jgi:Type II secretion system (T2SS), protein M subtype b
MSGAIDRRLLILLGVMVVAVTIRFATYSGDGGAKVVAAVDSIPAAEKRLLRVREQAATIAAKEGLLKQVTSELQAREKGLIQADTAAQAQAMLLDTIRRLASQNGFDARGADQFTEAKPLGDAYAMVSVTVTFTCAIEQLVNFLAMLDGQPEILSTNEINVTGTRDKGKAIQVRLGLSGVGPRKLLPPKKGPSL